MKFEALFPHETTQEHYAKAGFSYHISVYITGSLDVNGKPQKHINVHIVIMNEGVKQDSLNVTAITRTSLQIFHKGNPDVRFVYYKTDNVSTTYLPTLIHKLLQKLK